MEGFQNKYYAEVVIKGATEDYVGVEINGISNVGEPQEDGRQVVEVNNESPEFFSAYVRHKDGHAIAVCDVGTHAECLAWGNQLAARYRDQNWTVTDCFAEAHH